MFRDDFSAGTAVVRIDGAGNPLWYMQNIAVPVFQNETYEYGLERIITQELTTSFNRRSGIRVVQKMSDADAVLEVR